VICPPGDPPSESGRKHGRFPRFLKILVCANMALPSGEIHRGKRQGPIMKNATAPASARQRLPISAPVRSLTDAALVAEYAATGSERAFDEVVVRHGAMVFRTCLRLLGNPHEAEDAAQAAFIVLARRPGAVRSGLASWLHWVARNTAFKVIRSRARRTRHEKEAARMTNTVAAPNTTAPLKEELDAALARLPASLRQAVILRYLEGRSQEEAARLAGCPQGTLARRAMEGLQKLRTIFQRRGVVAWSAALTLVLAQEASAALPIVSLVPLKLAAARAVQSGTAHVLAESVLQTIFWAKVKLIGFTVTAAVTIAMAGGLVLRLAGTERAAPGATGSGPAAPSVRTLVAPKPGEAIACPADCVAFSPDGTSIASGRCDGSVRLWDARTGEEKAVFRGHSTRARGVAFSPDGKLLASCGWDNTVRLWDLASGKEKATLTGHQRWVWSVTFSADSKTLASASWDHTIKLWDVTTAKEVATLEGHRNWIHAVAFAPRGTLLASASSDGTVKLWDAATRRCRTTLASDMGEAVSVAFSPDGTTLAAGSLTHGVRLWEVAGGKERGRIAKEQVTGVAFAPDGASLASTGLDGTTILWNWAPGKERARFERGGWSVAFSPQGALMVAGGGNIVQCEAPIVPKRGTPAKTP
jgi:RNA polymerase sigma factor (sigma-70 family)